MEIGNREIKTLARGQPQETRAPAQDTYQGERSKGRYLGRHFQRRKNATKEKYDFADKDTSFTERIGAEAAEFEKPGTESTKLKKLRTKAEQAGEKTAKAKKEHRTRANTVLSANMTKRRERRRMCWKRRASRSP